MNPSGIYHSPEEFVTEKSRLYPNVTPMRYAYAGKLNRREKLHGISMLISLYDPEQGYLFMERIIWHKVQAKTVTEWEKWVSTTGMRKTVEYFIPMFNARNDRDVRYDKIILFHRKDRILGQHRGR